MTTTSTAYPPDINLGSLTTAFIAPTDCARINILPVFYGTETSSIGYLSAVIYTAPSCYPSLKPLGSSYTLSTLSLFSQHDEHIFYSPGLCPSNWTSRPVSTAVLSPTSPGGALASITETAAFCCPPGFSAWTQVHETGRTSDYFWRCDTEIRVPTAVSSGTLTALFGTTSLRADAVFIKYREGDFASPAIATMTSAVKGTGSSSATSSTSQTIAPTPAPASNGGLSSGAKIGLGVSVPLIVMVAGVFLVWIFMRRRKERAATAAASHEAQVTSEGPHYLPGYKAELEASSSEKATIAVDVIETASAAELDVGPENKNSGLQAQIAESHTSFIQSPENPSMPLTERDNRYQQQENTGPPTHLEGLERSAPLVRSAKEEELEYQERRLRERREILAERENIARDEEELRRQRMSKP